MSQLRKSSLTPSQTQIKAGKHHVRVKLLTRVVALLQEPERVFDNSAGSLVQTARDVLVCETFELRRQRNVHVDRSSVQKS